MFVPAVGAGIDLTTDPELHCSGSALGEQGGKTSSTFCPAGSNCEHANPQPWPEG